MSWQPRWSHHNKTRHENTMKSGCSWGSCHMPFFVGRRSRNWSWINQESEPSKVAIRTGHEANSRLKIKIPWHLWIFSRGNLNSERRNWFKLKLNMPCYAISDGHSIIDFYLMDPSSCWYSQFWNCVTFGTFSIQYIYLKKKSDSAPFF